MGIRASMRRRFFSTWPVAAAALAGLLALIGTSIVGTSRSAEEIYSQLDALNGHHQEVDRTLHRLRSDISLSGIYIRDYLLDTDRAHAPEYRRRLTDLRAANVAAVAQLRTLVPPDVRARIDSLDARLDEYWQTFEPLFDWTSAEKMLYSARFLRREVLPRREAVGSMAREIEALNDSNLASQRADAKKREADLRRGVHARLWRTLLLGFFVAVVAVLRLRALEHRSEEERRRAEEAERQMRLLSQQLVAAQEEERKSLTRELHDHVGQMLTALRMEIGRAERAREGGDGRALQALAEAKQLLDTILRSVRDLGMGLRPSMLDDFGLQPALEWHVRDFRRRFAISVDLRIEGDLSLLPDRYRTCVYRIVQEALTNCARHASAQNIEVAVVCDGSVLRLEVGDDGRGIDASRGRGVGLLGIEERVRELHGSFAIRRRVPSGTQLSASLPLPASDLEEARLARAAG